jgi:hypothetical protein
MSSKREPVERIVNFYSQKTLELLENEMTNDEPFEVILYHPSQSALARIEDDTEYDREETIGLWAAMFAGITFMCDNIANGRLTPKQAGFLIENLTLRCDQLLRDTTLDDDDLRVLYRTPQLQKAWTKINNPQIIERFAGHSPFVQVFNSFKELHTRLETLAQMDSLSSRLGSSMAISGPDVDRGHQTASASRFGSNTPQAFEAPRPTMSLEDACRVLGLPTELLRSDWLTLTKTVKAQVKEIVLSNQNSPQNCRMAKLAGQRLINYSRGNAGGGGKRRTMKVKKHFRKTKKRFVKRGKKTRVRRNK